MQVGGGYKDDRFVHKSLDVKEYLVKAKRAIAKAERRQCQIGGMKRRCCIEEKQVTTQTHDTNNTAQHTNVNENERRRGGAVCCECE